MQELLEYAASSQDEVCALIIDDTRLHLCRNVHPDPAHHFRISDADWLAAEETGRSRRYFTHIRSRYRCCQVLTAPCRL